MPHPPRQTDEQLRDLIGAITPKHTHLGVPRLQLVSLLDEIVERRTIEKENAIHAERMGRLGDIGERLVEIHDQVVLPLSAAEREVIRVVWPTVSPFESGTEQWRTFVVAVEKVFIHLGLVDPTTEGK
jgi:hypothetical protein